jgi:hypothetical protein
MILARWLCLRHMADLPGSLHTRAIGSRSRPVEGVIAVQDAVETCMPNARRWQQKTDSDPISTNLNAPMHSEWQESPVDAKAAGFSS